MRVLSLLVLFVAAVALTGCCSDMTNPVNPPAVAAAPLVAESSCGPLPTEAKPGEVWCCTRFDLPAAPPQRVCVQPECQREIPVPAVYENYSEQVLVTPEHTDWKRIECANQPGSECWALVTTPAVYETVTKQRMVSAASVRYETIPAVYQDVPSAPPPPVYKWVRNQACEPSVVLPAAAAPCK